MNAQQPAPRTRTVWDGAYTDAQAERARSTYETVCARCHTLTPQVAAQAQGGGQGGPLSGDKFWTAFTQKSVGDLLTYVTKNMPNGNGGTLMPATYNDLVALILKVNGFPVGPAEVAPAAVADIQIIPKDGPGELPANVLARVVGCLTRNGADWMLTQATVPERIDRAGVGASDATRPLGNRSVMLKFVLTKLDAFAGRRMSVSGMLVGTGGVGGINVSDVSPVADSCP
jgi:mono/diheme cytochrome c family protein